MAHCILYHTTKALRIEFSRRLIFDFRFMIRKMQNTANEVMKIIINKSQLALAFECPASLVNTTVVRDGNKLLVGGKIFGQHRFSIKQASINLLRKPICPCPLKNYRHDTFLRIETRIGE